MVREVFLDYQEIVSTRNDLGQLASMHNKYERLALYRLRASMKEFLGELPPEVERSFAEAARGRLRRRAAGLCPHAPDRAAQGRARANHRRGSRAGQVVRATLFTRSKETEELEAFAHEPGAKTNLYRRDSMAEAIQAPDGLLRRGGS